MAVTRTSQLVLSLLLLFFLSAFGSAFDIVNYGAKPDGRTDSSPALQAAWTKACGSTTPATIYVPKGRFLVRSGSFKGPCRNNAITVRIDGTLVAPADFRVLGNSAAWIALRDVDGIHISGGVLDGQGTSLWACKHSGKSCPTGTTSLEVANSQNVVITGLYSLNSQMFHIVVNGCRNVKIQGVTVSAAGNSPNTDGIHVQESSTVSILSSKIGTGDDCISIGPGATNLWIENVACGPGHGISIGSLGKDLEEAGVENVTVKTATFTATQNGVRIKSWGRPSYGFARNIAFQHIVMANVQNPVVIDQNYCPGGKGCPGQASGVKVSDVTYEDIHGTSASEIAMKFDCSPKKPCTGIRLDNVALSYKDEAGLASCSHAGVTATGILHPFTCRL